MNYKIKDLPTSERPRERLKEVGVSNLSDKELLSIILKTGTKDKNVELVALDILNNYKLDDFKNITISDLIKIKGVGEVKAIELIASIELGKRIFLKEGKKLEKLDSPEIIWEYSKYLFTGLKQEHFYAFYFNNRNELITNKLLFIGTINQATIHPREIFKEAYKVSAYSIVVLHNHPSGYTTPSKEDIILTEELIKIGKIQGIPVLDHIIVGDNNYFSFYENKDSLNI